MKHSLIATMLAAVFVLPFPALAHDGKQHAPVAVQAQDPAMQPAIAVIDAFSAALHAGDLKGVSALLADDVLILENGGAERSREEYLAEHAIQDAAFLKSAHSEIKQRTSRIDGNLAWVGTESESHTTKDGNELTYLTTETMVLKKTGEAWRIVHIHWSSRPKKSS